MKTYLFFLMLFFSGWMIAQEKQIIEANSGEDLSGKLLSNMRYLFPDFTDGKVFFKKSFLSTGKLNYNMLIGEMQFLENDELMALDAKDISMVNINDRLFFPYKGNEFSEELLSTDACKLRVRRKANVAPYAKKGAYGTTSSTSAITSYMNVDGGRGQMYNLSVTEDVLVSIRNFYYLVGDNGKYTQITNAKTFTKQFPAFRTQIETFVKAQQIRFDKEDDLKKLLLFCTNQN